ncbi:MAG: type VI secretion system protein IglI family protein [Polyangiaceae bacterium]
MSPISTGDGAGLEVIDPRLTGVIELADQRKFTDAANKAELLINERVFDIRPISVQLLDAFIQGGFLGLTDVFRATQLLTGESLPFVGPSKRREEQVDRRLAWAFGEIRDSLKFHETKRSEQWAEWQSGVTLDKAVACKDAGESLLQAWASGGFKNAQAAVSETVDFVRQLAAQLAKTQPKVEPVTVAPVVEIAPKPEEKPVAATGITSLDDLEPIRRRVELEVSHAFIELVVKVKLFEKLCEKGDLERAALVSDDVQGLLDSFDPRQYFPELLGRYCKLLSENIDEISTHWNERDSVAWRAYAQVYRMNPRGFSGE